jgi:hypothetical protein
MIDSSDVFCLLLDTNTAVSFVVRDLLNDLVMIPFMQSAKVVEACYNKHPDETLKVLRNLRKAISKPLG